MNLLGTTFITIQEAADLLKTSDRIIRAKIVEGYFDAYGPVPPAERSIYGTENAYRVHLVNPRWIGKKVLTCQEYIILDSGDRELKTISSVYDCSEKEVMIKIDPVQGEEEKPGSAPDIDKLILRNCAEGSENSLKKQGEIWHVRFNGGGATLIRHLDGFLYIAYLLQAAPESISCRNLYQTVNGPVVNSVMDGAEAISQGLNFGGTSQTINDDRAKQEYWNKYLSLQSDLKAADSDLERREIEEAIEKMSAAITDRNFSNPDSKNAQTNVGKRLQTAYEKLRISGLKNLADHLENSITTDGAFGLRYIDSKIWEIALD
jgi:hypothetical protein